MSYKVALIGKESEVTKFVENSFNDSECDITLRRYKIINELKDDNEFLNSCSLIILDIYYIDICKKIGIDLKIPVLVLLDKDPEDLETFNFESFNNFLLIDFIRRPFLKNIFLNKIKILIKLSEYNKTLKSDKTRLLSNIWDLLNYSNMYVVVLDGADFKIKMANYALSQSLGYEDEGQLIDKNWLDHIPDYEKENVRRVLNHIIDKQEKYLEFLNDITLTRKGDTIVSVKWFNSYINHTTNLIFSIGIPITQSPSHLDDIDSLRAYYKDIILKDREMIKSLKEVTKKYTEEILKKNGVEYKGLAKEF